MGDLIGLEGYLNTTTPFTLAEHKVRWKSERRYRDFEINNNYKGSATIRDSGKRLATEYILLSRAAMTSEYPYPTSLSHPTKDANSSAQ